MGLEFADSWGEAVTCYHLSNALRTCVASDEALGQPTLESDRAFLEQVRKKVTRSELLIGEPLTSSVEIAARPRFT